MMNILALSLVLTTIVTAGLFSPSPEKKNHGDDVILKEGHRTVMVEYENDDKGNTRVFISPQEAQKLQKSAEVVDGKTQEKMEDAKEKLKEGISTSEKDKDGHGYSRVSPRELVCDAYGKCKHKIASAIGRTKDKVYEKASEAAEKFHEVEEEVKEDVKEAFDKVKEKSQVVSDNVYEAKERVKEGASEIFNKGKEAKETIKEGVKEKAEKFKGVAEEVYETGKTLKGDVEKNASKKVEIMNNKVSEKAKEADEMWEHASEEVKEGTHKLKEEGKKELKEILQRGRDVFYDAFSYVVSPEKMVSALGVLQLFGIATAFGISIWVTFISSYVIARALPRQQFAMVQSKIYPVYFKVMSYNIGAILMAHLLSPRKKLPSGSQETLQGFNLLVALISVLVNLLIFEPRAKKVVHDRMKMEKEGVRGKETSTIADQPTSRIINSVTEPAVTQAAAAGDPHTTSTAAAAARTEERPEESESRAELTRLSKKLRKLNSVSSFLNIWSLMALTWHLVHLGQTLHCAC